MIPAYNSLVPKTRLAKLFNDVSKKVPPLSKADEGDLFVRLPILGSALQQALPQAVMDAVSETSSDDENKVVEELLRGLSEYTLSSEHLASARTAAASCIHGLLKHGFDRSSACPVKPLVQYVAGTLDSSGIDANPAQNCLSFLSLLVG